MKVNKKFRTGARRLLVVMATLPLLQSSCVNRSLDFVFGDEFFQGLLNDNPSNADRAGDILDEISDLFDDVF
jgi:hypothetical protein